MNYESFIKTHINKAMDYDGAAGAQCVDLIKYYLDEVFGIKPGAWGNAHDYYDNFNSYPDLVKNFTRIANTPEFVPKKGDIAVWKSSLSSGGWGHVAICTGEGDTSYFCSYDQNWTGNHDACTKIRHNYSHFAGVLRPKDQTKVSGEKVLDKKGYEFKDNTIGSYALKQLLILKGHNLSDNGVIGTGTVNAINKYLKKWGYAQNGIAGKNFIKKIRKEISKG